MRSVKYLQVEDDTSLIRDVSSKAIINNNDNEFEQYRRKKEVLMRTHNQIQHQVQEIESLKKDLTEIKDILKSLIKVDK